MKLLKYPEDRETLQHLLANCEYVGLLVPNIGEEAVKKAVGNAKELGFAALHTTPYWAERIVKMLEGSAVKPVANIAMMTGLETPFDIREAMVKDLLKQGVTDIDAGIERGHIDDGRYDTIEADLSKLAGAVHAQGGVFGGTIEAGILTDEQKIRLAETVIQSGADYLRICSGTDLLSGVACGRASYYEICLIKDAVQDRIKIKAGGGWDFAYAEDCLEQLACGADRVDAGDCLVEQLHRIGYGR